MDAGEPVWALATRFPVQGTWTEEDFFAFRAERPHIELVDGCIAVLPLGTNRHQAVLEAVLLLLKAYSRPPGGKRGVARVSGGRLRTGPGRFREPDVMYLTEGNRHHIREKFWSFADLAVEFVSPGPEDDVRDRVEKRQEYAEAGIPEYWIADPEDESILVLALRQGVYQEHGRFTRGQRFASPTLADLSVDVAAVFDAE